MIEAERLMRTRGLAKREVSRKSRLLHHMYTWVRIVGESTYVLHDYSALVAKLRPSAASGKAKQPIYAPAGPNVRLDDFLRFQRHKSDYQQDTSDCEPQESGLTDFHLENASENPDTLYGLMYGVDEGWLRLLSKTTRLANHMDAIRSNGDMLSGEPLSEALTRRASDLEDKICSFASTQLAITTDVVPNQHMHRALNSALVIFYYRRIKDVNKFILQSHVADVVGALSDFNQHLEERQLDGPGCVWPAFIAACEATSALNRDRLLAWIDNAIGKTGFHCYAAARDIILQVWRYDEPQRGPKKGSNRSSKPSWVDISRENRTWLIAC